VRGVLPVVSVPTLVVREYARGFRPSTGRYLAQHIRRVAYAELEGDNHLPSADPAPELLAEVLALLPGGDMRGLEPDKVLAAVLMPTADSIRRDRLWHAGAPRVRHSKISRPGWPESIFTSAAVSFACVRGRPLRPIASIYPRPRTVPAWRER
jgi:hypothetical protein